ncbi:MAG TPA: M48 family metallopeptidase [Desulfobacterales bacterium]|jgi:hypothetical protein|nr:M48 family metallopeptidase [Desulfobacterales bacterium]HJO61346.1 M48 family metallopeptidase [Desulfobacterales bacterium]
MGHHLFWIEGIGEIKFERSGKAKRINISVRPFKGVRVAVPYRVSYDKAKTFVNSKKKWIQKNMNKMKEMERNYQFLSLNFNDVDQQEAGKILAQKLEKWAKKHSFTYHRLFIRNQKTRWGSCSPKNNISLNMKLALLPERLMDYVILHELVHTRVKNHGLKFYIEMDSLISNRKSLDKELKGYGPGLL